MSVRNPRRNADSETTAKAAYDRENADSGSAARSGPVVEAHGLTLAYPRGPAILRDASVTVDAGKVVGLVGPNGGGKTTLLRSMAGFLPPQSGSIHLLDSPLYGRSALSRADRARILAVVLTDRVAPAYLRVRELVAMGRLPYRSLFGAEQEADRIAVDDALERTGAAHLADRPLSHLSDGERARVMVARALAQAPCVLLLDEPAAHLDPPHQTALFELLAQVVADGVVASVLVATHHLHLALHFSDDLLVVADGTVQSGPPCRLLEHGTLERAFRDAAGTSAGSGVLDPHRGWFVPRG